MLVAVLLACSAPGEHHAGSDMEAVASTSQQVIYGEDDRKDLYAADEPLFRDVALRSTAALVDEGDFARAPDGMLTFTTPPLGKRHLLCRTERFVSQPTLAACSATLVDQDLLLTAAHCLGEEWPCERQRWIFEYAIQAASGAIALRETNLYRCRTIALRGNDSALDALPFDYALVQLDRPVTRDKRVAAVADGVVEAGQKLTVVGYPSGLPVKIDAGASVLDAELGQRDYFALSSDTFAASSGSGIFDSRGKLVGALVRGGVDYLYQPEQRCFTARRVPEDVMAGPTYAEGAPDHGEQGIYAQRAITALCDSGWPSLSLCGGSSACGDGYCSIDEHEPHCEQDCPSLPLTLADQNPARDGSGSGCHVAATANTANTANTRVIPVEGATVLLLFASLFRSCWRRRRDGSVRRIAAQKHARV